MSDKMQTQQAASKHAFAPEDQPAKLEMITTTPPLVARTSSTTPTFVARGQYVSGSLRSGGKVDAQGSPLSYTA